MKVRHALWGAVISGAALAYWAPHHMDMNEQVFRQSHPFGEAGFKAGTRTVRTVDDYLRKVLFLSNGQDRQLKGVGFQKAALNPGQDTPDDRPRHDYTILDWNRHGGLWEDGFEDFTEGMKWGGLRAVNHFHDPLTGSGGYTGINHTIPDKGTGVPYVDLFRKGISVTQWVQNGTSGGRKNHWGYPTVVERMLKFYREQDSVKREVQLASVFRSLGQVEHLIEDNTVPDHTRDLPHPGRGFEEYLKDRVTTGSTNGGPSLLSAFPYAEWKFLPLTAVEADGFRAIWDRDVYTGAGASPEAEAQGLSEYVNRNFFAWNVVHQTDLVPAKTFTATDLAVFTTIPARPGQSFTRLSANSITAFFLPTPGLEYPFPKLGTQFSEGPTRLFYDAAPGSKPIHHLAASPFAVIDDTHLPVLNADTWADYERPLMARAHGYPVTVLSLTFPMARAEIIPDSINPYTSAQIRLTNLSTPGTDQGVTWHLDVVTTRPMNVPVMPGAPFVEPLVVFNTTDVAPGASVTSRPFAIPPAQRQHYIYATHTVVLVKAHLGAGAKLTEFSFGVPIPNGFPLIEQLETVDTTAVGTMSSATCCTECSACGKNETFRQPFQQTITARLTMKPVERDLLGDVASDEVKQAMAEDAKIVGVALVGYPRINQPLDEPTYPVASSIDLGASTTLQQAIPGLHLRKPNLTDEKDAPLLFTTKLDLYDYQDQLSGPGANAVFWAVWTSSGSMLLQRIRAWPIPSYQTIAQESANAACIFPRGWQMAAQSNGGCTVTTTGPMCAMLTSRTTEFAMSMAPLTGIAGVVNSNLDVQKLFVLGQMALTEFAGRPIASEATGRPVFDNCAAFAMTAFQANTDFFCPIGGAATLVRTRYRTAPGACPGIPIAFDFPRVAKYRRMWEVNPVGTPSPFDGSYWKNVMGIEAMPPSAELIVH